MAFNGSGTFNRIYSWITDAANGIFVSSTRMDADTNDIAAGLSNCVTRDGQSPATANLPMGGFKITGLGAGVAATDAARMDNANSAVNEFRLTLTTGVPVTMTDVTLATTIFCTPYKGNRIALYDGTTWHVRTSAQFSLALGTLTANLPYDVFCYDNASVPTLEFLAWTNATTRATALAYQDGVLSKTGALTRRYLGTFRTTSTTQTADSLALRYLWNYYNRALRNMSAPVAATAYTYTTATWREANGGAVERLSFVVGVAEDVVKSSVSANAANSTANIEFAVAIGVDSTSAPTMTTPKSFTGAVNIATTLSVTYNYLPAVGEHFLAWLEYSAATGTTTWNSVPTTSGTTPQIIGAIWG